MKALKENGETLRNRSFYRYVIFVFFVLIFFLIILIVFFRFFSRLSPESNNQIVLNNASDSKEDQSNVPNYVFPVKGRLIEFNNGVAVVLDRISDKKDEVIFSDLTTYYLWDQTNFRYIDGTVADLSIGDNLSLTYQLGKNTNVVSMAMITPPYFESGYVDRIAGDEISITDSRGNKYDLMNCNQATVEKSNETGGKIPISLNEVQIGDMLIAYSSYDIEYRDFAFEPIYINIVSTNIQPEGILGKEENLTELEYENSDFVNSDAVPAGINPTGLLPKVKIGQ